MYLLCMQNALPVQQDKWINEHQQRVMSLMTVLITVILSDNVFKSAIKAKIAEFNLPTLVKKPDKRN